MDAGSEKALKEIALFGMSTSPFLLYTKLPAKAGKRAKWPDSVNLGP